MKTNESSECQNQPDAAQVDGVVMPQRFRYRCVHDQGTWFYGVAFPSARSRRFWVLVASQRGFEADSKYTSNPEKTVVSWIEDAVEIQWIDKEQGWHDWSA